MKERCPEQRRKRSTSALPNRPNRSFRVGAAVVGVALVLIVILAFLMIARIEPGFAGVVYSPSGGVEEDVLNQGWHIIAPFKRVTEYPVSTETVYLSKDGDDGDHSFDISTKDGKNVNVDVVYSYHMDPEKLPAIFTKFRGQESDLIEAGFMKDRLKEAIQEVTTQYDVMEVYGEKRSELNRKVFEKFRDSLAPHGIIVETFNFSAIRPDKESLKAIQEKVNAKRPETPGGGNRPRFRRKSEDRSPRKGRAKVISEGPGGSQPDPPRLPQPGPSSTKP